MSYNELDTNKPLDTENIRKFIHSLPTRKTNDGSMMEMAWLVLHLVDRIDRLEKHDKEIYWSISE